MRWLVCLFCLNPLFALAETLACTDFPCEIFPTAASLHLRGQPSSVEHQSNFGDPYDSVTYRFNKQGLLLEKQYYRDGALADVGGYEAVLHKGRLESAWEYSGKPGDRDNASRQEIKKHDEQGRPAYISSMSRRDDGVISTVSQQTVAQIQYLSGGRLVTRYMKGPEGFQKVAMERREYDEAGSLAASCLVNHASETCAQGLSVQRYIAVGQISDKGPFANTEFEYEDGQLARKIVIDALTSQRLVTYYSDYTLDVCGNWTGRQVRMPEPREPQLESNTIVADPGQTASETPEKFYTYTETREITYHDRGRGCGPSPR